MWLVLMEVRMGGLETERGKAIEEMTFDEITAERRRIASTGRVTYDARGMRMVPTLRDDPEDRVLADFYNALADRHAVLEAERVGGETGEPEIWSVEMHRHVDGWQVRLGGSGSRAFGSYLVEDTSVPSGPNLPLLVLSEAISRLLRRHRQIEMKGPKSPRGGPTAGFER
jgi:hypothetical protein